MPGLSAQALATAGVTPGSAVKAGGLSFTWPAPAAGAADNVVAGGQAILAGGSGTTLGFLVTGTYGTATGTGTILYSDGTSQSFTLSAPDWYAGPPAGSDVAITMPYRNAPGNAQDRHPVQVYYVGVPLAQGTTVQAVILPNVSASPPSAGSPALHVFAMAIG
jgi:alpha-L-fucosidase 2